MSGDANRRQDDRGELNAASHRECPDCGGHGWIMVPDKKGNPTQIQCQRCNGNGYIAVRDTVDLLARPLLRFLNG